MIVLMNKETNSSPLQEKKKQRRRENLRKLQGDIAVKLILC